MSRKLLENNGIIYYVLNKSFKIEALELLTRSLMMNPFFIALNAKGYHVSY